jgi:hypothetical protein
MGAGWLLLAILSPIGFKRPAVWALIPGGALLLTGLVQVFRPDIELYVRVLRDIWPYAAIVAGIALLIFSSRRGKGPGNPASG